jgi:tRNA(Ile)-lysidine synthase TilS/MesJ
MKCLHCVRNAVYELRYSGHWVCRRHFIELFERRVKKTIRQGRLLAKDDFVIVGLSGGNDSMTALKIIHDILHLNPQARLEAATVDDGVEKAALKGLSDYCRKLGVKHHVIIPERVKGGKAGVNPDIDILLGFATKRGASKLATGENLDDEILDAFMSLLAGEAESIRKVKNKSCEVKNNAIRIRVLRECPEDEAKFYAKLLKLPILGKGTGPQESPYRATGKKLLDDLEKNHPGAKFQMLRSIDEFALIIDEGAH